MGARAGAFTETRERITRGALGLFRDNWFEDVTLAAIALAADVSHQTVLNHFGSKEGVVRAVAELVAQDTRGRRSKAVKGDIRSAVTVLVAEYERVGDANVRWAVASDRVGSLAPLLDDARAAHQHWLEDIFGERLSSVAAARRQALNALHAATDVYTWKLLRRDLRLSSAETAQTMIKLVSGVLESLLREDP